MAYVSKNLHVDWKMALSDGTWLQMVRNDAGVRFLEVIAADGDSNLATESYDECIRLNPTARDIQVIRGALDELEASRR